MKFNFKKVVSVLATTAMLGSTVAFAAAAYPEPFVKSGAADAAIIIGSAVDASDMAAATDLQTSLNAGVTVTTGATVSGTGDKVKLEKNSVKINLGDTLTGVWGTSLTSADLPTLLADETYRNTNNDEYAYTQKIDLGALNLTDFADSDYNDRTPTLGYDLSSNTFVANYTINFKTSPQSTDGTDLVDFENTNIVILGKEYYILDFKNSTAKMTLLDSAATATVSEGEEKTLTVDGKTYVVKINFIGADQVKFDINGEVTNKLTSTANTYKLTDGAYVGVREINVQDYAGGSKSVEFSIGKGKLELTDGSAVKMNDKTVTPGDVTAFITKGGVVSGKQTLSKIVLQWKLADKAFLTPGKELVLPGFEAFKFTMADMTMPAKETTTVEYSSDDVLQMKTTIKDGDVTIPLLYASTTTGNLTGIGKSATEKLITSNTTSLTYNATDSGNRFVVSWANARDSESYYLKATVAQGTDGNLNTTTISKYTDGAWSDVCSEVTTSIGKCSLGNAELTLSSVAYMPGGERSITVSVNSGGSFNKLYTKEGLLIYLPWSATTTAADTTAEKGAIDLTKDAINSNVTGHNAASFYLYASEEDRNGDLAAGKTFYLTLDTSGTSSYKTSVTAVTNAGTQYETKSSSKIWESYIPSELATKVTQDKTNSDQYSAEIEYHGAEVTGNVYVAAPTVVSGADAAKIQVYKDTEANAVKDKNLIVVGGSCINSVARMIVDATATTPICGADFTAKTNVIAGGYLIQVAASPLNAGKVAMLVAGYNAADTTAAVAKVKEGKVDTTKNGATVYPIVGTGQ